MRCRQAGAWERALSLHARFRQAPVDGIRRCSVSRLMPPVLVEVGELAGVIYRSRRGRAPCARTFVHFFERAPLLATDPDGRRLFVIGGQYRVTRRGIEG